MTPRARGRKRINYAHETAVVRTSGQWFCLLTGLGLMVLLPFLLLWSENARWLTFLNMTFITIIAVLGLNIITGMAGQVSMGHAAFVMLGAFLTGAFTLNLGWSFWLAMPISALLTAVIGTMVGAPSLRLKGFYLAIATLAFFMLAQFIIKKIDFFGGIFGLYSIPSPVIFGWKINTELEWYFLGLVFLLVFTVFSVNLTRSSQGRSFFAIRDNDNVASSLGIKPYTAKLRAFFIGSLYAGVAGSLLAAYLTVVRLDQFTLWDSIWYLGMIVIGGAGSTAGTIMGVVFLLLIKQLLLQFSMASWTPSFGTYLHYITSAVYGIIIIVFVSFQPYGLLAFWKKIRSRVKTWPLA